jgi:2-polyprenyl-3-methyl-5-hydroxy-6-metoxy-1,4-benzoquinol methylase
MFFKSMNFLTRWITLNTLKSNWDRVLHERIYRYSIKYFKRYLESKSIANPLSGDRCIEYAFVIKNLKDLNRNRYKKILDVGCYASPLTTIVKELGFIVDGIDLLSSPCIYNGVNYIKNDFLLQKFSKPYDIVILCSTIEHIGLKGRYGSPNIKDGDLRTLKKIKKILTPNGMLILTIPYGEDKIIMPLHRVYNKNSNLLKYAYDNFQILIEEFYKNNSENIWIKCKESDVRKTIPTENNYALGLFVFKNF